MATAFDLSRFSSACDLGGACAPGVCAHGPVCSSARVNPRAPYLLLRLAKRFMAYQTPEDPREAGVGAGLGHTFPAAKRLQAPSWYLPSAGEDHAALRPHLSGLRPTRRTPPQLRTVHRGRADACPGRSWAQGPDRTSEPPACTLPSSLHPDWWPGMAAVTPAMASAPAAERREGYGPHSFALRIPPSRVCARVPSTPHPAQPAVGGPKAAARPQPWPPQLAVFHSTGLHPF